MHVVRNAYFGEERKFELYQGSKIREEVESRGGKSITLPDLADRVADKHLRKTHLARGGSAGASHDTIVSASPPPQIVERGKLVDTLIVEAVCDKFIEHLPIERQCTRFARAGVDVAPSTLGRSVAAAIDLLAPVARLIEEQTRAPGLLGTDATGIPCSIPVRPRASATARSGLGPMRAG